MRVLAFHRIIVACAFVLAQLAPGAASAAFRTYLASDGLDTNPCSLPQPCRLLPAALATVDPGGEVWILDSANFNTATVTINKSVTILAIPGAVGSFVGNGADALSINGAGIRVSLRNLVFVNLVGGANNGVSFVQGTSLTIKDSSFTGLTSAAVFLNAAGAKGMVINSTFERNGAGVRVFSGTMTLVTSNFLMNTVAVEASGPGRTGSSGAAVEPPNGSTRVFVSGGTFLENGTAFHMDSPGNRLSNACNGSNIFLQHQSTLHRGNTVNISVTGAADVNNGCGYSDMGTFSPGTVPYFNFL